MAVWKIEIEDQQFEVDVKRLEAGLAKVVVGGTLYEVAWSEDRQQPAVTPAAAALPGPEPVAALPRRRAASTGMSPRGMVSSPLPGLIIDLLCEPGDKVRRGQVVIKIEAMKMANEVRAQVSGTVREVFVKEGETVDEGAHLLRIG